MIDPESCAVSSGRWFAILIKLSSLLARCTWKRGSSSVISEKYAASEIWFRLVSSWDSQYCSYDNPEQARLLLRMTAGAVVTTSPSLSLFTFQPQCEAGSLILAQDG